MQGAAELSDEELLALVRRLEYLTPASIQQIDDLLAQLPDFGSITLQKRSGKLRFVDLTESYEVTR